MGNINHSMLVYVYNAGCTVFLGKSKSNLGWTPLHLACYFGHKDVVEELLKVCAVFGCSYKRNGRAKL